MTDVIELFGEDITVGFAAIALVYFLLLLLPLYWPTSHAIRNRTRLPRPYLFIGVITTIVYGAFAFLTYAIRVPLLLYSGFFEPILSGAGYGGGAALASNINQYIELYGTFLAVPFQVLMTILLTRWLSRRWAKITQAFAA